MQNMWLKTFFSFARLFFGCFFFKQTFRHRASSCQLMCAAVTVLEKNKLYRHNKVRMTQRRVLLVSSNQAGEKLGLNMRFGKDWKVEDGQRGGNGPKPAANEWREVRGGVVALPSSALSFTVTLPPLAPQRPGRRRWCNAMDRFTNRQESVLMHMYVTGGTAHKFRALTCAAAERPGSPPLFSLRPLWRKTLSRRFNSRRCLAFILAKPFAV